MFKRTRAMARAMARAANHRAALACAVCILALAPSAHAGVFGGAPDAIVCSVDDPIDVQPWDKLVFYVSARLENGGILYKTLTSNPVLVTVDPDGRLQAKNLADCDGKSVDELRELGRAFDL